MSGIELIMFNCTESAIVTARIIKTFSAIISFSAIQFLFDGDKSVLCYIG